MIDPLVSLAFSIQANRGVYALMLGSGVSRSAQIPTGWEIVLDLIRKLAKLEREDCEPEPAAWYKDRFGKDPDYSELLDAIAKSPAERNQLLRDYFEPDEEEREEGIKLPTVAHKAIAKMVARGYIRVVVTTNFDHLLEKALTEEGIEPTVISTADSVKGALPLVHTNCTIIKVNGDYLDTRIRNTREELAIYEEDINYLLDRVFDEFGLIVSGWSGEWDTALRSALERCKNHRFTTYWTDIRPPDGNASRLIQLRKGEFILIRSADAFFDELSEKVFILEEYNRPHPLSVKALVAQVKKYLVEERYEIRLEDLMNQEREKLFNELSDKDKFPVFGFPRDKFDDEFRRQVKLYESLTEPVLAMMITGCYLGKKSHERLWVNCLERIANPPEEWGERYTAIYNLRLYSALLLLYGGGIASIAAGNYSNFSSLITIPTVKLEYRDEVPLVKGLDTWSVMQEGIQRLLPGFERNYTPLSDHLYKILRDQLREFLPQETRYRKYFDRFEYLFDLVQFDIIKEYRHGGYGLIGSFSWRCNHLPSSEVNIMDEIESEASEAGDAWPLLKTGIFGGDFERFKVAKQEFDKYIADITRGWR